MICRKNFHFFSKTFSNSQSIKISDIDNLLKNIENLPTLKKINNILVQEAMRRTNNNQSLASKILGISQQALSQRLKKL